ncbi:MAG TPA: FAD binding domain-containing protein [Thermoanaerobaculia bacterium]
MRDFVIVHVNGAAHRIAGEQLFQTLSRFLRESLAETGTKIVCEEGDCGACTVLLGKHEEGVLRYRPVNSCIQFLFQLDCTHVVTVEGLTKGGQLTPVQDAMVATHGAQCGYCTPGFVMALAGVFEETPAPVADQVRCGLTGNLCRCTGYEPIIRAALETRDQPLIEDLYPGEPILAAIREHERIPVLTSKFSKPSDLESAIAFKAEHSSTVIVQGATDVGVWRTKRQFPLDAVLSLDAIPGLREVNLEEGVLSVGGSATLAQFEEAVRDRVPELREIMDRFGSPQIRNAGTLAGNIANASPIADSLPFLFVTESAVELTGRSGTRRVAIGDFYLGYKKLDVQQDEIITRILIPLPAPGEILRLYKVSKRSHLDISTFTAGFLLRRSADRIESIRIAFGGVAPVVLRLPRTEKFLAGKQIALETFQQAGGIARTEVAPISDVRGSKEYRLRLAETILSKFYWEIEGPSPDVPQSLSPDHVHR